MMAVFNCGESFFFDTKCGKEKEEACCERQGFPYAAPVRSTSFVTRFSLAVRLHDSIESLIRVH